MRKFLQSLSGEVTSKQVPKERIDLFKALLHDLATTAKGENKTHSTSVIPQILNKIIQILLEEEREAQANQEGTGPCIEYFLQSRILELLCNLAAINKPVGMFQWIVNAISRIIQHMKSPLMAHSSMHKPLVRLLASKPSKLSFEEKMEVLKLINSLALKLKEAPIFLKLFWTDNSPTSPAGQPHSSIHASSPASPSFSPSTSPIVTNPLQAQLKVAELPSEPKKHFVLFKTLDRIYRAGGDRRLMEQVRRCILSCMVIDDNYNELQAYMAKQTKFMQHTMKELGKLYATLARETYSGSSTCNQLLQEYFRQIQFCTLLCKIDFSKSEENSSNMQKQAVQDGQNSSVSEKLSHLLLLPPSTPEYAEFSQKLAETMKRSFFEPILLPGLLSDDPKLANIHTIFARETLLQLDAPELMGALVSSLIGTAESSAPISFGEPSTSDVPGHIVQETLISRIEFKAFQYPMEINDKRVAILAANTMRLFSTLFQFHPHNLYVAHHLLFKNLPIVANPDAHLRAFFHPTEAEELGATPYKNALDQNWPKIPQVVFAAQALASLPENPQNLGQRFEQLLEWSPLSKHTQDAGSRPDVQTYHDYVKLKFNASRAQLLTWSSYPESPECILPAPLIPGKKKEQSAALPMKVVDLDPSESQDIKPWLILRPTVADEVPGNNVQARRFLLTLIDVFEHFLELPLDSALYVTDIFASISQYPHAFIHKWIYSQNPAGSPKSLFQVLNEQCEKAKQMVEQEPALLPKIMSFKAAAEKKEVVDNPFETSEDERAVSGLVMLDEFCKEILANMLLVQQVLN